MITLDKLGFQPGWSTPIQIDFKNLALLGSWLGFESSHGDCRARRQGKCPGPNQCHDCAWSSE